MKKLHLVYIPFTGVGLRGGYRGDKWFKKRIEIFKKYTLKSLVAQANQDFVLWLSFRPEEQGSPLLAELDYSLTKACIRYIFTFDGLMYHDDKFTRDFVQRVANAGRVIRQNYRNRTFKGLWHNLIEIFQDKNATLEERLTRSLAQLPHPKSSWVYLTRIDSDDMFSSDTVGNIQSFNPETWPSNQTRAITCARGYIYNTDTKEVALWNPPTNPPFHTILFPERKFWSPALHIAHYRGYKSHEDVTRLFDCFLLPDGSYCVTTSDPKIHISTIWNHPFRGPLVDRNILHDFGL